MRAGVLIAAAALAGSATCAEAQAAPACAGPEHRALDFWIGDWELAFTQADGGVGTAENRITREFSGCVIAERFSQPSGFEGASHSIYDAQRRVWRQTWVDNAGGVFVLEGGPTKDAPHVFELRTVEPRGADQRVRRMTWENVGPDALTWRWQAEGPDGAWRDLWVLNYRRKPG